MRCALGCADCLQRDFGAVARRGAFWEELDVPVEAELVVHRPVAGVADQLHRDLSAGEALIGAETRRGRDVMLVDLVDVELHAAPRGRLVEQAACYC